MINNRRDANLINIQHAVFWEVSFEKKHALHIHLTYKYLDRFRNGAVHEFHLVTHRGIT